MGQEHFLLAQPSLLCSAIDVPKEALHTGRVEPESHALASQSIRETVDETLNGAKAALALIRRYPGHACAINQRGAPDLKARSLGCERLKRKRGDVGHEKMSQPRLVDFKSVIDGAALML